MLTTLPHFTIDMGVGGRGVAWRGVAPGVSAFRYR